MKTHHLNCGTMRPPGAPVVCHVLLVETDNGLVLVDSGYGLKDCADPDPDRAVAPPAPAGLRSPRRPLRDRSKRSASVATTCATSSRTHLRRRPRRRHRRLPRRPGPRHRGRGTGRDAVPDPPARRRRFRAAQWAHGPKIVEHDPDGEAWRGFAAAKELDDHRARHWCWCRCPATPAGTRASPSTPDIVGFCIAATRSTTAARWTGSRRCRSA